jgi:hypothetical protein
MKVTARPYSAQDVTRWDDFVDTSWNGTFLHTRRFLAYHGSRFEDVSLLLEAGGKLVGVLPAAVDPLMNQRVVSHPGATFGGIVHCGLQGQAMIAALGAAANFYREQGFSSLRYKVVPHIFHRVPSSDDLYALYHHGSCRYRCDLGAVLDYQVPHLVSQRRLRGRKKAARSGVVIVRGRDLLCDFWPILETVLDKKYGVTPTHSLAEMQQLCDLFPTIDCVAAQVHGQTIAGVVLFKHPQVDHMQYAAANEIGLKLSALDLVLSRCFEEGRVAGKKHFSFGISSEHGGLFLNSGLYDWKTGFGAGGMVHEFYEMAIGCAQIDPNASETYDLEPTIRGQAYRSLEETKG